MSRPRSKLPAGITYEEKHDRYRVRTQQDGKTITVGRYRTLTDAKAALELARIQIIQGTYTPPAIRRAQARERTEAKANSAVTVSNWATQWLNDLYANAEAGAVSMGTAREYESVTRLHILPILGELPIATVTPTDIERMCEVARVGTSSALAATVFKIARRMFNEAVRSHIGGLVASPVDDARTPAKPRRSGIDARSMASPEEVSSLADSMPPRLALSVHLAAWLALRQGEVLGLQRGDFHALEDPESAFLTVLRQWNQKAMPPSYTPTKAKDTRILPIPGTLLPLIQAHLDAYTGPDMDAPVFPSLHGLSRPCSQTAHNRAWAQAKATCGLPDLRFHDLRHTALTTYARTGATLAEIMALGGHSDVNTAMRYQHAASARARALANALPIPTIKEM